MVSILAVNGHAVAFVQIACARAVLPVSAETAVIGSAGIAVAGGTISGFEAVA